MCAIIDANMVNALLKAEGTAGGFLLKQVNSRKIRIAVGGHKLKEEYQKAGFERWIVEAIRAGIIRQEEDQEVDDRASCLLHKHKAGTADFRSDDYHIIALAQISGARMLCSGDQRLHRDFVNKELISNPRGKVYATSVDESLDKKHRRLLSQRLCSRRE